MEDTTPTPLPENETHEPAEQQPRPVVLPTQLWAILLLVTFAIGLGSGYLIWARPQEARAAAAEQKLAAAEEASAAQATAAAQGAQVDVPEQVKRYDVPMDDDPIFGSETAEITIIEFSDYECPFCQRWHEEAWPQIKAKYGDKVRLVFRDYPLDSIHPNAIPAAEAANCAGDQDRYWEFNELLFTGGKPLNSATYDEYAKQVGLDLKSFQQCVSDRTHQDEVAKDLAYANELGVRSTPTFFVNGLAVVGAQPFEVFEQIIDMELAGQIPK